MYLMKGMAVLAMGLVTASCNRMDFDQDAYQRAKEQESKESFMNNVMGGQEIDPNQTWKTTEAEKVTVSSELNGSLKIYTANPHGNVAAALLTQTIEAGSYEFTVTKPKDAEQLYAKLTLEDGSIRVSELTDNTVSFVKSPANATLYQAARRASQKGIVFPDAPASYPTTYPEGTTAYPAGSRYYSLNGGSIYIDETSGNYFDVQGGGDIYVVKNGNGKITPSDYWYIGAGWQKTIRLFICPGAVLDISKNQNIQKDVEVYVAPGATLKCSSELVLNSTAKLYVAEGATLDIPSMDINAYNTGEGLYSVFYNQGITTIGRLAVENGHATVINEGTLNVSKFDVNGSGMLWNKGGTMNVTNADRTEGTTTVNSNNAVWINDGQYNTVNFEYTAGSENVWNNCKLTVYNRFYINLGQNATSSFKLDGGTSVIVKEFRMEANSRVIMGGNSIIKVIEKAVMYNTAQSFENAGIIGPQEGDLYAVLQSPVGEKGDEVNSKYVCYNGNVYIATDSHFAQKDEETNNPMYRLLGNAKIVNGQTAAPYTIPKNGNCSDGYNGGGGGGNEDPIMYYYYAFEDLGAIGDFDFNDVVLRLSAPENGVSNVELVAAGGTLPVQVIYGDKNVGNEVHNEFGVDTKIMVNTGSGVEKPFKSLGTVEIAGDADMSNLPFGIVVTGNNGEIVKVTNEVDHKGTAPLMIVVSGYPSSLNGISTEDVGKWFWAKERVNISSAYTQFGAWGADVSKNTNWYYYFTDGKVWKY